MAFYDPARDNSGFIASTELASSLSASSCKAKPLKRHLRESMSEQTTTPALRVKGRLMSASEIERTLVRLAHEIVEKSNGSEDLTLIGIKRRGVPFAQRLGKLISNIEKRPVESGMLDIQFYRDDLST